jgi:hypothetical protein
MYQSATVAQMRQGAPGDYEVANVVAIALTSSTSSPHVFFQDAGGGDFSAMVGSCSSTSTSHPCTVASTVAGIKDGYGLTLRGAYLKSTSGLESFYIDDIVVSTTTRPLPAAATVALADVQRNAATKRLWFQRVTLALGGSTLAMYDFSPAELHYTPAPGATCPNYFGWGMVPSTSSDTRGGACSGTTQPPSPVGSAAPADEVLIGTEFYKTFTYSADCACALSPLTATSTHGGTVNAMLIGDLLFGQTTTYQYLAPKSVADATLH